MDGIHDMGGMHGFGPIIRAENEPLFHHPWEGRVLAITVATPVPVPGGARNNIENMDPAHYLSSSYYEKWLYARIKGLIDAGVLTSEELAARTALFRDHPDAETPLHPNPAAVRAELKRSRPAAPPPQPMAIQPQFSPGDHVQSRNIHPAGHTRLPRYARGKYGMVASFYGIYNLQDAELPAGYATRQQPLYAVRFDAEELWGSAADVNSAVYLDMWESYLKPA